MIMEEPMTNQELANLDLSKVAALQQKRTLAFVNHFMITTVQFLNSFMRKCEYKLMNFEKKLEKVEAAMVLLEARLSSIPEVNNPAETEKQEESVKEQSTEKSEENPNTEQENHNEKSEQSTENISNAKEKPQITPEYERFVKMVHVGVPLEAVKLKASLEGLDASVLEKIFNK